MRKRIRKNTDDAEVNVTPMLDIVFIMLIFFIVTATFLDVKGFELRPPAPNEDDVPSKPRPAISVWIDEANRVSVDGQPSDMTAVASRVERIRAEKPTASVILRVHEDAWHGTVVYVKDSLHGIDSKLEVVRADSIGYSR